MFYDFVLVIDAIFKLAQAKQSYAHMKFQVRLIEMRTVLMTVKSKWLTVVFFYVSWNICEMTKH